ncbi:2-succinyl-5-enolpyruvyl-6-hydroxy-3-cyclohexene-1-carboxylic-acid synthase [Barnesiella propionica]|uniref:2-succinyl-5-enolpyruvyl-6-hydroxy-3- cyclohexene-1-carboxylic-acid synthase n=1 Tax=Barnesiella propionica TaxID=2981781 RepID=UPI0011C8D86D|nr:2-succinyl-5-enolpyruvyl-6-hydroxy-3-cyclohexene-1-carboxylic-acid synthase [Barnesiella propionica]MCU6767917.1 2-succinyl-5-enolpyruvyl-6-hydroxy-3-cyclohexene-1-carboxylic-acid synthase [Barnesiella propionica]
METTDKEACLILVDLLVKKGVRRAVLSPGSRNAPLLVAFARTREIEHYVMVDERSAAFMALGMCQQTGEPVALICTSGSALLNYAPAVAEAYYQHLPLIVISADRPVEWIDQNDSQTIRQQDALRPLVKRVCTFPTAVFGEEERWYINRMVNDALNYAVRGEKGPVHINVPLREPLCEVRFCEKISSRNVIVTEPESVLSEWDLSQMTQEYSSAGRVMIIAAFGSPDKELNTALSALAGLDNTIVFTESIANLKDERFISTIDRVLSVTTREEKKSLAPDLLITLGGALVSRIIKKYLRDNPPKYHWYFSKSEFLIDTMQCITRQVTVNASSALERLSKTVVSPESDYSVNWHRQASLATRLHDSYVSGVGWCDLKAFSLILPAIPQGTALQLSNGTSVRYAQLFPCEQVSRADANRGVSGIDGSTSTALGASCVYEGTTLLITGDMSFTYDVNGLASSYNSPRFKIIVMCNGGGGIFRFIKGPSDLKELEECFEVARDIPVEGYAALFGYRFFRASNEEELKSLLPVFFAEDKSPAILAVETPRVENSVVLRGYFRRRPR